jgi:C_GCAxxG_C_C family probable redox protein
MKSAESVNTNRRHFIKLLPGMVMGTGFCSAMALAQDPKKQKRMFREPFGPDELKTVHRSVIAKYLAEFTGKGYSCAELILNASVRYLEKPKEWVHAAAAFGGGLGKGDLCGFFTGGMMAIGFASGMEHSEDLKILHRKAREKANAYWDWWQQWGPVHCRDLREQYEGSEEFLRLGQRAAMKIESLIK